MERRAILRAREPAEMKIAQLVNTLEFGGTERMVVNLALALSRRGHDVTVFCLRTAGPLASELGDAGIPVIALEKPDGPNLRVFGRLTRSLRRGRFDVIHGHNPLVHHYALAC